MQIQGSTFDIARDEEDSQANNLNDEGTIILQDLKICINTQTPLVQFIPKDNGGPAISTDNLQNLVEGVDYRFSPGGVTRMVYPLVKHLLEDKTLANVDWVSLNPTGPETMKIGDITLHHISLEKERLASYGNVKEVIWGTVHGTNGHGANLEEIEDVFWSEDFPEFAYYNRQSAELIRKLDAKKDFDLFYIHDFQQLPLGHMLGTLKPKIFRWHIPFDVSMIPAEWKEAVITYFNSYDMVIVSAERYLDSLKTFGYRGRARKLYPYVDPNDYTVPSKEDIQRTCEKLGIKDNDEVILTVARMDPMKGQDRAIEALRSVAGEFPNLKLVLIGNGSFSGKGLGISKSETWRRKLEGLVKEIQVQDKVIFAGHQDQKSLDALYERCNFTVLPSVNEGFGLVVVESWLHHKASIVTDRAGIAELVKENENGLLFNPDNIASLSAKVRSLLNDPQSATRMGEKGFETAKLCTVESGVKVEKRLIAELVGD